MSNQSNNNKLLVPGAQNAVDSMKAEIANEFGVQLGADTTSSPKWFSWWRNHKTISKNGSRNN